MTSDPQTIRLVRDLRGRTRTKREQHRADMLTLTDLYSRLS